MKKVLLNFADGLLSREQMKVVRGGEYGEGGQESGGSSNNSGTCAAKCYWPNGASDSIWNLSKTDAIAHANLCASDGARGYWCCASC